MYINPKHANLEPVPSLSLRFGGVAVISIYGAYNSSLMYVLYMKLSTYLSPLKLKT